MWNFNATVAVYLGERFNSASVRHEIGNLVRSNTLQVLDAPEALFVFLGERLDSGPARDLKVVSRCVAHVCPNMIFQCMLLWAAVPPIMAISLFERRYQNHPLVLQYAHRVMEEHPVDFTFFFVPQVVQALRYDDLGTYLAFVLKSSK